MKKQPLCVKLLVMSSVLFFIGLALASVSSKIFAITTTLWFLNVVWCIKTLLLPTKSSVTEFVDNLDERQKEAFKNKERFKGSVYVVAFPMMVIGAVFAVIQIVLLFLI